MGEAITAVAATTTVGTAATTMAGGITSAARHGDLATLPRNSRGCPMLTNATQNLQIFAVVSAIHYVSEVGSR
jgi:hypothetical protein